MEAPEIELLEYLWRADKYKGVPCQFRIGLESLEKDSLLKVRKSQGLEQRSDVTWRQPFAIGDGVEKVMASWLAGRQKAVEES